MTSETISILNKHANITRVVEVTSERSIVTIKNRKGEFVTYIMLADGSFHWGHYFKSEDRANADFNARVEEYQNA